MQQAQLRLKKKTIYKKRLFLINNIFKETVINPLLEYRRKKERERKKLKHAHYIVGVNVYIFVIFADLEHLVDVTFLSLIQLTSSKG